MSLLRSRSPYFTWQEVCSARAAGKYMLTHLLLSFYADPFTLCHVSSIGQLTLPYARALATGNTCRLIMTMRCSWLRIWTPRHASMLQTARDPTLLEISCLREQHMPLPIHMRRKAAAWFVLKRWERYVSAWHRYLLTQHHVMGCCCSSQRFCPEEGPLAHVYALHCLQIGYQMGFHIRSTTSHSTPSFPETMLLVLLHERRKQNPTMCAGSDC
jgi:hypothetical protein